MLRTIFSFLFAFVLAAQGTPWMPSKYTPTGATSAVTVKSVLDGLPIPVESFGAKGDGVTDDSAAIIACDTYVATTASGSPYDRSGKFTFFAPGKVYKCNSALDFQGNVWGLGAELLFPIDTTFTGTAVTIGSPTTVYEGKHCYLPLIKTTKADNTNWNAAPNSIGLLIYNAQYSEFHISGVRNFATGVWFTTGNSNWCGYNTTHLGMILDNKINLKIQAGNVSASEWINENRFFGGRMSHSSNYGTNNPEVRSLLIHQAATAAAITTGSITASIVKATGVITWNSGGGTDFSAAGFYVGCRVTMTGWANAGNNGTYRVSAVGTTTMTLASNTWAALGTGEASKAGVTIVTEGTPFGSIPDNNNFFGVTLESEAADGMLEIRGGFQNNFYGCRFEKTGTADVFLFGMSSSTAVTTGNSIFGGYTNAGVDLTPTVNTWATGNAVYMSRRVGLSSTSDYGVIQGMNYSSDTKPFISIWGNASGDGKLINPSGTTWLGQWGAYYLQMKSAANTQPTFQVAGNGIAGSASVFQLGDGSTAIGMGFNAVSGNQGWCEVPAGTLSGGFAHMSKQVVSGALSGATTVITFSIPTGAQLKAVQMRVDTLITSGAGTSWSAAFSGGSTTAIGAGTYAFTKSTKVNAMLAGTEITTNTTNITLTCNGGTFTGGVVQAVVFYDYFVTLAAAP